MRRTRVIIMGAAGRDFHNFNVHFRDKRTYEVVAFTAAQIPGIEGRRYPGVLAGKLYPQGIPIYEEDELDRLLAEFNVDQVVFAYSDVSYSYVMHKAAQIMATGADFKLLGTHATQIKSTKPVISICAVRTGSGKSPTTRYVAAALRRMGLRPVIIRHPMPYGELAKQVVQRFATYRDLDLHQVTIEEREEYEPHLDQGYVVYAGVDYEQILRQAEQEADVILWDGGNNDLPFYEPDLHIVIADPHRSGHEISYFPGETNVRMADIVVINKVDTADHTDIDTVRNNIERINPAATIVFGASPLYLDEPMAIRGKRVLVIEDGPTVTHGEMPYGAGTIAARRFGAAELIDPRPFAVGSLREVYAKYPHIGAALPAMGYGATQIAELEETIHAAGADLVVAATPIDLRRVIRLDVPIQRVRYELQVIGEPSLEELLVTALTQKEVMAQLSRSLV
ncbi:MAG: GTPase [Anaerolineae bacterium]|nr:GTPase [Anaerolineae bacterium]